MNPSQSIFWWASFSTVADWGQLALGSSKMWCERKTSFWLLLSVKPPERLVMWIDIYLLFYNGQLKWNFVRYPENFPCPFFFPQPCFLQKVNSKFLHTWRPQRANTFSTLPCMLQEPSSIIYIPSWVATTPNKSIKKSTVVHKSKNTTPQPFLLQYFIILHCSTHCVHRTAVLDSR